MRSVSSHHRDQRLDLDRLDRLAPNRLDSSAHGESTLQRECQPDATKFTLVTSTNHGARTCRAVWDVAP